MRLTMSQQEAIAHAGRNLQLIACAGSGKTEVVARRVVYLLNPDRKNSLAPANIIAFTFTEKAAAELKERIVTRTRQELGEINGLAEMFVGTIHAFCLELLKSEAPRYLKYEVLNEVQQALFVDRHSKQSGLTTSTDLNGRHLKRYRDTNHYITALSILREAEIEDHKLDGCSILDGLDAYRRLLDERSYLDYSAILEAAVDVITNDHGLRKRIAERVKYVIVDEYQDVNPVQEAVVWLLHNLGARICVVGDDDQTIYQWRGSDVQNILTFADRYPKVERISLEENFRSSDGIVETARAFIAKNRTRLPKAMQPTGAQPYEPGDLVALSFHDPDEEAAYIAETIKTLRGVAFREGEEERGLSWSDMAILLRSVKANAEPITSALQTAGIPFVVTGMTNLFATAEAEAARQLFYFIGDHAGVDEAAAELAWNAARLRLGLDPNVLRTAIDGAAAARAALTDPDQKRWGQYSIQRVFLNFLDQAGVREERVPDGRGEVVFYNLGKFSQLISDFETIHYHSKPVEKYASFADFLRYRAQDAYPEGWQDNQYANPDAVRIMTVHQAKGMQWPVVFIPALLKNRFPAKKPGGRNVWSLLPRNGIRDQVRFEGTIEDERRLFYVAMTRSQKFLHLTWAPVLGNQLFQKRSAFWDDILVSKHVKRRWPDYTSRRRLPPVSRAGIANVVFSFSDLKYFFECPYQFKLRILYGFNAPIHEALGYGKSLHDALAEIHTRAIRGDVADDAEVPRLVETHLHAPYAYPALRQLLEAAAERVLRNYLSDNRDLFDKIEFSEKQIEINLGDGITVNGRIDLVRRVDTGETTIVDLKSSEHTQAEDVTEAQLHVYALGYQELTGPGDIVFDPTCGSGTTAFCAEKLGRRWITCDTSRVAINVARQRLLSATFEHYKTRNGNPASGFLYKTVDRITLRSLAYDLEPEKVELVDQPEVDPSAIRVTGPFEVMTLGRYSVEDWKGYVVAEAQPGYGEEARLENYIETICRLYRKDAAIQGASGLVHAVAESETEKIALSVGPLSGRVSAKQIHDAVQDALASGILEVHVLGWAFEANVGEVKSQLEKRGRVKVELIMIRPDTLAEGLKATQPEMLFSPLALPDIEVEIRRNGNVQEAIVALKGVALFDRKHRTTEYKAADSGYVSAWYLDEDYDGDCFVDCQMFFDFKRKPAISRLGITVDDAEFILKLRSEPFPVHGYRRIAAKVVDVYGNESTVVRDLG